LSVEEVARELDVKKFLVKFWEKEFKLNLERARDEHRCYSQENLKVFVAIKDLVHNKKMSISQAKKQIGTHLENRDGQESHEEHHQPLAEHEVAVAAGDSFIAAEQEVCSSVQPAVTLVEEKSQEKPLIQNLQTFKEQLINFKQLLDLD